MPDPSDADDVAVASVVADYWEGWFTGDVERISRALHPDLVKSGALGDPDRLARMTAADMVSWTADGEGVANRARGLPYQVEVVDLLHPIATVVVRSGIFREYLHLVRTPAGWKILNALYRRVDDA